MEEVEGVRRELRKLKKEIKRLRKCVEAGLEECERTMREQRERGG